MIALTSQSSAQTWAPVVFSESPDSDLFLLSTRTSRTATLDGGVTVYHGGFAHGDRSPRIRADIDEGVADNLKEMIEEDTIIIVGFSGGLFSCAVERMSIDGGQLDLSLIIKEKLSA